MGQGGSRRRRDARRAGGAAIWIAVALAVVAALLGFYFLQRGVEEGASSQPASANHEEMDAALGQLQQQLAAVVQHKRDPRPLLAEAQRIVERYPESAEARISYAQVLFFSARPEEGYEQLLIALELDPAQPEVRLLAGSTVMQLGQIDEAERHFNQAVALRPQDAKYRLMLATAQLRQNKYDDARRTLLQAIKLDSNYDAAYATLSDLYSEQNRIGPALDQINRALSLVPADEESRVEAYLRKKAGLLLRDNRPTEAMAALRELPARRLVDPEISQTLAGIWMRLGQPERAASHYEQIVIINPTAAWAAERAAHYRLEANQPEEARKNLDILRRINPRAPAINDIERALHASGTESAPPQGDG